MKNLEFAVLVVMVVFGGYFLGFIQIDFSKLDSFIIFGVPMLHSHWMNERGQSSPGSQREKGS